MLNTPCWKHCFVLRQFDAHVCHLPSSGRLPLSAPIAVAYVYKRILPVPVTFTRSCGDVCLARTNRFARSVRSPLKEMKKSEHGGASIATDIKRTLELSAEGQRMPNAWKRECASRLLESRRFIRMFLITRRKTHFCILLRKHEKKPDYHE